MLLAPLIPVAGLDGGAEGGPEGGTVAESIVAALPSLTAPSVVFWAFMAGDEFCDGS